MLIFKLNFLYFKNYLVVVILILLFCAGLAYGQKRQFPIKDLILK